MMLPAAIIPNRIINANLTGSICPCTPDFSSSRRKYPVTAMTGKMSITHIEPIILNIKLRCVSTPPISFSLKKPTLRCLWTSRSVRKKKSIMPRGGTIAMVSHTFTVCTLDRSARIVKGIYAMSRPIIHLNRDPIECI